ncbi:FAD-binding domain-containing protein [Pseudorhodobacter sp. MZDSW-24AT]|uniref:FAD-binding domain-containing protein n=1 Tax=Pseudorhodobacter sp. MZDSW-24AT TaxID=2052957 RepID=UPI000C1EC85E|nr:FAD-binding domain-containing protein [Pseudorhodobacter sp. MZDSW-24AT]PJF08283.1 DNA photolyase [Pseudorhodobacter sp. MZDSW-24AT]
MKTPFPHPTATRDSALAQLHRFLPLAGKDYAIRRNLHRPGHPHVSQLSPYLRSRILTEAEVIHAVRAAHGAEADTFVSEVLWRTYWKGWLEMRPQVWRETRAAVHAALARLDRDRDLARTHEAACAGQTGIDGFDDWARDLVATGYMHNHQRMCFASIWIFTLHLPWQLGADFFLRHLLDGDPASNTLSWRWVAGLHTPGKTYLAKAEAITTLSDGRYWPKGLATQDFPISGPANPPAGPCPQGGAWDHGLPTALLLHEEDLSPDWLLNAGLRPLSTAFLLDPEARSPRPVSPLIKDFLRQGVEDCIQRHSADLASLHGPVHGPGAVDAVVAWARQTAALQVVTPFAPVGPVADLLTDLDQRLAAENIRLVRAMRPYDAALWPHATHGFFRFHQAARALV